MQHLCLSPLGLADLTGIFFVAHACLVTTALEEKKKEEMTIPLGQKVIVPD